MYTTTQLKQVSIDEILYDSELNMTRNYGNFMGNGKFYEIGTSLAETAVMANGLIPKLRVSIQAKVSARVMLGYVTSLLNPCSTPFYILG